MRLDRITLDDICDSAMKEAKKADTANPQGTAWMTLANAANTLSIIEQVGEYMNDLAL